VIGRWQGDQLSTVLARQLVGPKEVKDGIGLVNSLHYDLGCTDLEQNPATQRQPVRHEVVTHLLEQIVI
jgi:hypothetical protein